MFGEELEIRVEFADVLHHVFEGAVAKWLRQRIANPSYPGSSPGGAYLGLPDKYKKGCIFRESCPVCS